MSSEFDPHDPQDPSAERPDGVIVVSTAESPLHFAIRDDVEVAEGMVCLGAYLGERLIAQDARPQSVAERLIAFGGGSARLVYATAPDGAGLSGYLYALLPAAGLHELLAGDEDEEEEAPWSLSARAYESAVGDEDEEGEEEEAELVLEEGEEEEGEGDDEEEEEDEEDDGIPEEAQVLVPLGAIRRVYRARPDSVEEEAADVLAHIVAGEVTTVDAQTVEQFLKDL